MFGEGLLFGMVSFQKVGFEQNLKIQNIFENFNYDISVSDLFYHILKISCFL